MTDKYLLQRFTHRAGYNQESLAKAVKISYNSYSMKANNKSDFKISEVKRICEKLGLTAEERDMVFFAE